MCRIMEKIFCPSFVQELSAEDIGKCQELKQQLEWNKVADGIICDFCAGAIDVPVEVKECSSDIWSIFCGWGVKDG